MLKEDTKEILANAFLQLVETKDLNKITVSDIVSVCHASRQTFYNHFNDKEELISWIYLHETENILQQLNEGLTYAECLHTILVGIEKKKFFI